MSAPMGMAGACACGCGCTTMAYPFWLQQAGGPESVKKKRKKPWLRVKESEKRA